MINIIPININDSPTTSAVITYWNYPSITFTLQMIQPLFVCNISFFSIPTDAEWFFTQILTSNRSYNNSTSLDQFDATSDGTHPTTFSHTVIADMDANDTMTIRVYQFSGTTSADIANGSNYTYVQGTLLC